MIVTAQSAYADAINAKGVTAGGTQNVRDAVMAAIKELNPAGTNKPTGAAQAGVDMGALSPKPGNIVSHVNKVHAPAAAGGQIALVFVGETHTSAKDLSRAQTIINGIAGATFTPGLIVLERGMNYNTTGVAVPIVRESNLTTSRNSGAPGGDFGLAALGVAERSIVVAGYILLCLASGNQTTNDLVIIFFGERHKDILEQFEYIAGHGGRTGVDWVEKRPRTLSVIRSQA